MDRPLADVDLVEAWAHARRHLPNLDPFSADARGLDVDGVRVVFDRHGPVIVVVLVDDDAVWTIDADGDREPFMVRWHDGHGVQVHRDDFAAMLDG